MTLKRRRDDADFATRAATFKRPRHTALPDLLSPLSDELLVRILSFLPLPDLLNISPLSQRFYHISGDSQIWKRLYYSRFVLPRALRIPGFRDGSARDGKLHYSSRKAIWADGRRGGWVDMRNGGESQHLRNWKRQYKLRHNWSKGKCAVEELQVGPMTIRPEAELQHKMLVKISEGIAVTADLATGLRVWDLKTKQLLAQIGLEETGSTRTPSCMTIDDQGIHDGILDLAIGFTDGSFGVWRLDTRESRLVRRYRHESSSNGELLGIAFLYPYLLTATKSVHISLYTFEGAPKTVPSGTKPAVGIEAERGSETKMARESGSGREEKPGPNHEAQSKDHVPATPLRPPYLLTSLKSHTSRAPLTLSIRRMAGGAIASIAYTFSTIQGWSLGIQDLHIKSPVSTSKTTPEVMSTRLAYTLPASSSIPSPPTSPSRLGRSSASASDEDTSYGPISLCYTHPYLLATLPDNTLILHLCTSNASSLSISPGIRLWGHTSGISDAEITARGKAVSVSCRGEEIRVWELEGRAEGKSIEVRATAKGLDDAEASEEEDQSAVQWDERRNWVGFDDEMVIVLKESREGRESLMVYDFT
ncbi:hypothetical protein F4778DRAFT_769997 [Xylariomycetidae sp. FL2044]|nr:hypothetical protein F4778DRAFT_769997 [Xylariomycetidae sp. FL2044]